MKMTQTIPTDKNGNVYYGAKTVVAAERLIRVMDAPVESVVRDLREAGYDRVAAIIARKFLPEAA